MDKKDSKKPEIVIDKPKAVVEKPKAKKPSFWKLAGYIIGILIWVAVVVVACEFAITFGLYKLIGKENLSTPVWTTVCTALIYSVATFLIIWVPKKYFKQKKITREDLGFQNLPTWTDILLAPVGFIVYLILAAILTNLFELLPFYDAEQVQDLGYAINNGFDRVVAFLALCIVAPIAEELIFRGWLYAKLRNKIPGKVLSIVLSTFFVSLLFGLLHGQWNVGVNVFAMSIVLCGLREVTGTIHAGILLHMLKNTVAFVLVYILGFGG